MDIKTTYMRSPILNVVRNIYLNYLITRRNTGKYTRNTGKIYKKYTSQLPLPDSFGFEEGA